jgi:hypothetical protein
MGMKWMKAALAVLALVVSGSVIAQSQSAPAPAQSKQAPATVAVAPFDISGSFFKTFTASTTGNGTIDNPVDSYGGMVGGRYIPRPWVGLEVTYSYNKADQQYSVEKGACNYECANQPVTITGSTSQVSVDYVASKRMGHLTPFALGGVGFVIGIGSGHEYAINTIVRLGYIAGAGVDIGSPRFGIRVQGRDTFSKAPDLTFAYFPTGKFTQTVEPMVGIYFRPW